MATIPYQSFVNTKPFIVIGPAKTIFYVHANLLAQISPILRVDVEGEMQEKRLETIEVEAIDGDIDDDTVGRFIEYAYSGEYTVPGPDIVQLPTDSEELQAAFKSDMALDEDEWAIPIKKSKKNKKKPTISAWGAGSPVREEPIPEPDIQLDFRVEDGSKFEPEAETTQENPGPTLRLVDSDRRQLWESLRSKSGPMSRPTWRPRANGDDREDYTGIFLCHARLYKFADRYQCEGLMSLALRRLRLTLYVYRLYPLRMGDVTELVRYTYAHTLDREHERDKCRAVVLEFVLCYIHELVEYQPFLQLLQEGGPLASDCLTEVAKFVS